MHYARYRTVLSPQGGFNLYRGCTHGCIYCDSRSACYQMKHDFEDIEVKQDAPAMLDRELSSRRKKQMLMTGSMCDPYIPLERELGYTRACLESILRRGFGAAILTKSDLILRDEDLIRAINARTKCVVQMTLTCADDRMSRKIEPNVCTTRRRHEVLKRFQQLGVPTVVWMGPVLPFLTDTEENVRELLELCADAGVKGVVSFAMGMTLREGNREYYYQALDRLFPGTKRQYVQAFGNSYECPSPNAEKLDKLFHGFCERHGILHDLRQVLDYVQEFPKEGEQLEMNL